MFKNASNNLDNETRNQKLALTGGIVGALGASSCCILPLALLSMGISGAWIGQMAKLEPYKPFFILMAIGFLAWGYYLAFRKPKPCDASQVCAKPLSKTLLKTSLVVATFLTLAALFWPQIVPLILG